MEQTSAVLPTSGFRQSSPAIRAAENFALSARHHDPQLRYRALNLVKRLRAHIGLSAELLEHLDYLVAHTNDVGWSAGRPIVYKDQQTQAYNLGISDRQIRNREKRLMELGFISFEDSGNHRRYAVGSDDYGHPDLAFGINLMPLLGRLEELENLAEAVEAETRAWQQAKKVYSARRRKATALIKELAHCDDREKEVSELTERLQNLPYVRPSTHLTAVHRMVLHVDEIISEADLLLEARNPQETCELTVDTSSREEIDFLCIHYTKNLLSIESCNPPVDESEQRSLRSQVDIEADASAPAKDKTTGKGAENRAERPPVQPNPAGNRGFTSCLGGCTRDYGRLVGSALPRPGRDPGAESGRVSARDDRAGQIRGSASAQIFLRHSHRNEERAMNSYLFLASLAAMIFSAPQTVAQEPISADPDFEARIEQYLMQHPEILRRALMNMQRWQEAQQAEQQRLALIEAQETFLKSPDLPVIGNPDGALMIVEFFDYHCGYCKQVFDEVVALTQAEPELKIVFLEFPILSDDSRTAALAALAADRQGRYAEIHKAFMTARGQLTHQRIMEIAGDIGLDTAQLQTDMKDPALTEHLSRNSMFAQQLGVSGTPAFIVANQVVPGANMARVRDLLALAAEAAS